MGFLYSDVKARAKVLNPNFASDDSTKFNGWSDAAIKIATLQQQAIYIDTQDVFCKKSTLPGTAPVSGSKIVATSVEDIFEIALVTDAVKVADDVITIYNPAAAEFQEVPRIEQANIIIGTTTFAFYEVNGNIILYVKDSSIFATVPFKVQYDYWRKLAVPVADGDPVDIKDADFDSFVGIFMQYMPEAA